MSVIPKIWHELQHCEQYCDRYWYLWRNRGEETYLDNYHWYMGRRRYLFKWLLKEQLKEFDYE